MRRDRPKACAIVGGGNAPVTGDPSVNALKGPARTQAPTKRIEVHTRELWTCHRALSADVADLTGRTAMLLADRSLAERNERQRNDAFFRFVRPGPA